MTGGLLISRITKNNLHKLAIQTPTVDNINKYKTYRNLYNKVLRASKKSYYCEGLHKAKKNPKKTWDLLKEGLNRSSMPPRIDKLTVNNSVISEPVQIANAFNGFFSEAGVYIANLVNVTDRAPESFLKDTVAQEFQMG
jgi:hypothetical protein